MSFCIPLKRLLTGAPQESDFGVNRKARSLPGPLASKTLSPTIMEVDILAPGRTILLQEGDNSTSSVAGRVPYRL